MNPSTEKQVLDYRRIEQAIRYIDGHVRRQPDLAEVAAQVGLSPYHFQRLFRRWAGVSPKRFLEYLTVEHAKRLLAQSESVLTTAHELGLSGPARLHDHFVSIEAVTPGEFKNGGVGLKITYGYAPSPFGDTFVARTARGICALSFLDPRTGEEELDRLHHTWPASAFVHNDTQARETVARLFAVPTGKSEPFPLAVRGTNYQINVWNALLRIPVGAIATYRQIAQTIDNSRAARSVATAIGANPVALLIPCHRVIRGDGALGGYRWGESRKAAIIGWEQAVQEHEDG